MFSWFLSKKKVEEPTSEQARQLNLDEFRREATFIDEEWNPKNRLVFCVILAIAWREFLAESHSPSQFAALSHEVQMERFKKLLGRMAYWQEQFELLRTAEDSSELMEAISHRLAYKFMGFYLAAIMYGDKSDERTYAEQLDNYCKQGWELSGAVPKRL